MKTATIEEVFTRPEEMLKEQDAVIVTKDGEAAAVVYPIHDPRKLPLEVRRVLFAESSAKITQKLREQGITEEQIERDVEEFFKNRGRR